MIFYCLLASYCFRTNDLSRWVVGNAFLMCTNTCVFGLGGVFTGERYNGRLRSIVAAPCAKLPLVLASGVFPALLASVAVAAGLALGGLLFGVDFSGLDRGRAALTILCAMVSASCFGLFISVFGLLTDSIHMVLNVTSYLLLIFTGAEFPVSQLPAAGRVFPPCSWANSCWRRCMFFWLWPCSGAWSGPAAAAASWICFKKTLWKIPTAPLCNVGAALCGVPQKAPH